VTRHKGTSKKGQLFPYVEPKEHPRLKKDCTLKEVQGTGDETVSFDEKYAAVGIQA